MEPTFCFIRLQSGGIPARRITTGAAQLDAWRTIQRAHAIANGVFVAAVNRVGYEGPAENGLEFWGSSFVADPFGQIIAQASMDQEERFWWWNATPRGMERRSDGTGPFYATDESMLTLPFFRAGWIRQSEVRRNGLSHARGVGAARSNLARLAA